ncbi:MAG: cell division topological specificity factor MinE [Sporomusaceae bacterium]|nr:cell division topological specificity factor MinE [Sporomusaceae bacterium]
MFKTMRTKMRYLFGKDEEKSKDVAKKRLQVVLVHDRINLPPRYMDNVKDDMLKAISTYMEVNEHQTQINLTRNQNVLSLVAVIPINRVKRGLESALPVE